MGENYNTSETSNATSTVQPSLTWQLNAASKVYYTVNPGTAFTGHTSNWGTAKYHPTPPSQWQAFKHAQVSTTLDTPGLVHVTVTDQDDNTWTASFPNADSNKHLKTVYTPIDADPVDLLTYPPPAVTGAFNTSLFTQTSFHATLKYTPKYIPAHPPSPTPSIYDDIFTPPTPPAPQIPTPTIVWDDTDALVEYLGFIQTDHDWVPFTYDLAFYWVAPTDGMIQCDDDWTVPQYTKSILARIRRIARGFGPGGIVGRGRGKMNKQQRHDWLTAWLTGDLRTCWTIEASVTTPDDAHPGNPVYNLATIIWQPAVHGEIPAGQSITGGWPAPPMDWDDEAVSTYLVYAHHKHPTKLNNPERRHWVNAHLLGDTTTTNWLSLRAAKRTYNQTYTPPTVHPRPWTVPYTERNDPPNTWNLPTLRAYATHHKLRYIHTYPRLLHQIEQHLANQRLQDEIERNILRFETDPDQPTLTGYHRKTVLRDQHGHRWLFKPAPDGRAFRADTEHHANTIARAWGYRTAESRLIEHDGVYGHAQRWHDNATSLTGVDLTTLTINQLIDIACEHLLDWALDNDDGHPENLLQLPDRTIVGIDKGRAWRYFGGWDGLSGDHTSDTNCALLYTRLYQAIANGTITRTATDHIYSAVLTRAHRIQQYPDTQLDECIRAAVTDRPHYRPSTYQTPVAHAPTNADELVTAARTRKNQLVTDMQALWTRVYHAAGHDLPTEADLPLTNVQGHPIHTNIHDPLVHDTIRRTKLYGTPVFVAGTAVEDAHILFWRERRHDHTWRIRGHLKVRGPVRDTISAWCLKALNDNTSADNTPKRFPTDTITTFNLETATRHRSSTNENPQLADDGELHLLPNLFNTFGYHYRTVLHTGDVIDYRSDTNTGTPLTMQGTLTLTLTDDNDLPTRITTVLTQLQSMGLTITPATQHDLELFYWRHLAGIITNRRDRTSTTYLQMAEYHHRLGNRFAPGPGQLTTTDPAEELTIWRHAFAAFTTEEQIAAFLTAGEHLPRFMHQDLRRPQQPCGSPFWHRFDTTLTHARTKQMPAMSYRTGPTNVIHTGVCMSTEARMRHLAVPKHGMSSFEDANEGAAAFMFTRQNLETFSRNAVSILLNPHIHLRTSNYAFNSDHYGRLKDRPTECSWNFDHTTALRGSGNELLIKNAASLLDDVEILGFPDYEQRDAAIARLHQLGITEIRGIPIATRCIWQHDIESRDEAIKQIRATY